MSISFIGFIELVGTVYLLTGYLGFILMIAIIISCFKRFRSKQIIESYDEKHIKSI